MATRSYVRQAVRKARRFVGRVVYVVRDFHGRIHCTLTNRFRGVMLLLCGALKDGTVIIVRHV